MKIDTKFFGQMEIAEDAIITFENGIPGFQDLHKFIVINEKDSPFNYLQSTEEKYLCFVMMNPFAIIPDYDFDLSQGSLDQLDVKAPEDITVYSILTIPEDIKNMTANMQAPIVINAVNKRGVQEIIDNDNYSRKHKLIKETDA